MKAWLMPNLTGPYAQERGRLLPACLPNCRSIGIIQLRQTSPPCGTIAGIFARTDTDRGVWKAPAGIDAAYAACNGLRVPPTDRGQRHLNPLGINCLRDVPGLRATSSWGARTLRGADDLAIEWKYVPVRRMALFIEESLYRGTQWVVFEPNDEPLWAQIRLNVGAFMQNLFRQGAFQGQTPQRRVLRQVRQRDHHAERHQPRHRQHPGRLRAAQARRVRRHPDPADRRTDRRPDGGPEAMAQFTVNPQRFDPYKNFKFRVKWDGRYVAGISKVSALKRTTEVVKHREGGDPSTSRKSPGRTEVRRHHARARRHPRHRVRAVGQQGLELRRRARRARSR